MMEKGTVMTTAKSNDVDEVMEYVERFAEGWPAGASNCMFYFLYKEILVNRISILEADPSGNRAGIEHNERIINVLNEKLMAQLQEQKK